jgi:hypothetical protein
MRRSCADSTIAAQEPSRKFFAPARQSLLLKGGWPTQKQLPAARGSGFRRFTSRRAALRAGDVGVGGALQKPRRVERGHRVLHGWLYLPWVIKPLWSPVVDILKTRRQWIWAMQLLLGAGWRRGADDSRAAFFPAGRSRFSGCWRSARRRTTSRRTVFTCWRRRSASSRFSSASAACFIAWQRLPRRAAGDSRGKFTSAPAIMRRLVNGVRARRGNFSVLGHLSLAHFAETGARPAKAIAARKKFSRGIFQDFGTFFQKPKIGRAAAVPAALPAGRGAA